MKLWNSCQGNVWIITFDWIGEGCGAFLHTLNLNVVFFVKHTWLRAFSHHWLSRPRAPCFFFIYFIMVWALCVFLKYIFVASRGRRRREELSCADRSTCNSCQHQTGPKVSAAPSQNQFTLPVSDPTTSPWKTPRDKGEPFYYSGKNAGFTFSMDFTRQLLGLTLCLPHHRAFEVDFISRPHFFLLAPRCVNTGWRQQM